MSRTEHTVEQTVHKRTQVSRRSALLKDKPILFAVIAVCLVVALGGFLPMGAHKKNEVLEEKQDSNGALSQNMALIRDLKEASNRQHAMMRAHASDGVGSTATRKASSSVSQELLARMNAPSTFFSANINARGDSTTESTLKGHDANSTFLNEQNDIAMVSAKQLPHPTLTVPAGEMIPATLETAINSELAGMARAITMRDVYALSGNRLLIPKGSMLVGQFNTNLSQGQSRIFVVWNRVQLASGVVVTLNSPSSDAIGRSGQAADYSDRHFFERFGSGVLLSVLGGYAAIGGVSGQDEYNSVSQYRMNIAGNLQQTGAQAVQRDMKIAPTLQVNQGTQITVFVARDLDFYRVAKRG